jgi:hypothetical protein
MPRTVSGLLIAAGALASAAAEAQQGGPFREVGAALGLEMSAAYGTAERPWVTDSGGAGAGWIDYDGDGRLDLFVANGLAGPSDRPYEATRAALAGAPLAESRLPDGRMPHNELFRSDGNRVRPVGALAGVADSAWSNAVVAGDIDNDGFVDLIVTTIGPNISYRNNGDGTFSRWELGLEDERWGTGLALLDWDLDGDLDAYLANYVDFDAATTGTLGDGVCNYMGIEVFCGPMGLTGSQDVFFENVDGAGMRPWSGIEVDPERTFGFAAIGFDCDNTPGQEIYVANDSNINLLYRRDGGDIEDLSLFSGAGFSGAGREQAGMGIAAGDVDDDGDLDLLVSNFQRDYNTLYENLGDCVFQDRAAETGLAAGSYPYMAWASLFFDADGDGDLDAFVANGHLYPQLADRGLEEFGQPNHLYLNELRQTGRVSFEIAAVGTGTERSSRGAAFGDFDNDRDLDVVVTQIDASPALLRNETAMARPALRLTLVGRSSSRTPYGTRVEVTSGATTQVRELRAGDGYLGSNDTRLLFFLPGDQADRVEIRWPRGATVVYENVAPGDLLIDEEHGLRAAYQ